MPFFLLDRRVFGALLVALFLAWQVYAAHFALTKPDTRTHEQRGHVCHSHVESVGCFR